MLILWLDIKVNHQSVFAIISVRQRSACNYTSAKPLQFSCTHNYLVWPVFVRPKWIQTWREGVTSWSNCEPEASLGSSASGILAHAPQTSNMGYKIPSARLPGSSVCTLFCGIYNCNFVLFPYV